MESLFSFMKSTRSILAVMGMLLLYIIVIGYFGGIQLPNEIINLVGMVVAAITTAYFGKRNNDE